MDNECAWCGKEYASHRSSNKCLDGVHTFVKAGELLIKDVPVGSRVRLYANAGSNAYAVSNPTGYFLEATVMPNSSHLDALLGWKQGEQPVSFSWMDGGLFSGTDYVYGWWVEKTLPVYRVLTTAAIVSSSSSVSTGMKCSGKNCLDPYNSFANGNQSDGTFLCWSCRQRPSYMR